MSNKIRIYILMGVLFLIILWLLIPRLSVLDKQKEKHKELQLILNKQKDLYNNIHVFKQQLQDVDNELLQIEFKIPKKLELASILKVINEAATNAGLTIILLKPKEPQFNNWYYETEITMQADGKYDGFKKFINIIINIKRLITFCEFELKLHPRKNNKKQIIEPVLNIDLIIKVYSKTREEI